MTIPDPVAQWLRAYDGLEIAVTLVFWGAVIWGFFTFLKKTWPGFLTLIEFIKALGRLPEFMRQTDENLAIVKHEVLPNNGGSLRDEVTTQGLRLEKVDAKMQKDHARVDGLERILTTRENTRRAAYALSPDTGDIICADSFNPTIAPFPVHDDRGDQS